MAAPRKTTTTTFARRGLASISGWFELKYVDYINSAACELGYTLQQLVELGLKAMMKKPVELPPAVEEKEAAAPVQKSKPRKRKKNGVRDGSRDRRGEVRERPV